MYLAAAGVEFRKVELMMSSCWCGRRYSVE